MKIKLFIVEQDQNYLDKISSVFISKYSDKLEVYAFTDAQMAVSQATINHADVAVVNPSTGLTADDFPIDASFAFLSDQPGVEKIDDVKAINKFQRADMIYKEILDVYAEGHANVSGKGKGGAARLITFCSPAGGTGASSLAAAAAKRCAAKGEKCLYLNLEKYGDADAFFEGEGGHTFTDIIYALKSRKANLELKLESTVKQDACGAYYFSGTENAMDMQEITGEEIKELVNALIKTSSYSHIFLDMDYSVSDDALDIFGLSSYIVETSDGLEISNRKVGRAFEALKVIEQERGKDISRKVVLMYNKFSNKVSSEITGCDIKSIGGAPKYEHASTKEVINELSKIGALDEII